MKMRTTTLLKNFTGAMLAATLCFTASAQSIVPPSAALPDNYVAPGAYPNSATIDYTPFCGGGSPVGCQLTAVTIDGGQAGPSPILAVNDQVSGWVSVLLPAPTHCMPDVAIGNDFEMPGAYIAAVTLTKLSASGFDVYLLLYHIFGAGSGSLTISGPYATYTLSSPGMAVQQPSHIDIIGEYSTPFFGLPQADKFAVSWAEAASPGPVNIMGYYGSLNGFFPPVTQIVATGVYGAPDVAAVERSGPGGFEDWALFTYTGILGGNTNLYYQEWQMNPGAPPSPSAIIGYENYAFQPWWSPVRIDAIDNFMLNSPGGPNAYYEVAAAAYGTTSGSDVFQYNNFGHSNITSSIPPSSGWGAYMPVVTCGPGPAYSVGYYMEDPYGTSQAYYTTSIDWPSGMPTASGDAYQVNTNPYTAGWVPDPRIGLTLSTTCNVDITPSIGTQQMFVGWQNSSDIYSKYANTFPYVYKHNAQTAAAATTTWAISPNPANDYAVLSAPTGFDVASKATYQVQDMAGKTLIRSSIAGSAQQIDISKLAAGMYIVNINGDNAATVSLKLVKE